MSLALYAVNDGLATPAKKGLQVSTSQLSKGRIGWGVSDSLQTIQNLVKALIWAKPLSHRRMFQPTAGRRRKCSR